ncbi:MAG: hypothetical protein R3F37_22135 [Candidatus Competibacteraceae bacterium]
MFNILDESNAQQALPSRLQEHYPSTHMLFCLAVIQVHQSQNHLSDGTASLFYIRDTGMLEALLV